MGMAVYIPDIDFVSLYKSAVEKNIRILWCSGLYL